jgi:hypothetical protein
MKRKVILNSERSLSCLAVISESISTLSSVPVDSHLSLVQNSYMLAFLDMSRPDSAKDAAIRQVGISWPFCRSLLELESLQVRTKSM